jgi:hypothetical protein
MGVGSLALFVAGFVGCQSDHAEHHMEHPAHVEHIHGSDVSKVTLTERAIQRIDVKTAAVRSHSEAGMVQPMVPYSSLIYDPHGHTWVYTSPEPRTFVRHPVEVDRIEGDWAYLAKGPAVGTQVASVGVAELYGTEFEVGH